MSTFKSYWNADDEFGLGFLVGRAKSLYSITRFAANSFFLTVAIDFAMER